MKKELRQKYKTLRKALTKNEISMLSEKIFSKTVSHFELAGKKISVFLPIDKFNEIDTWYFINQIQADFYLPVMFDEKLKHIKFESKDQIKQNDWGIWEPQYGEEINPRELDIVLVPLLTFDQKGNRIGYGKGYYDQFLKNCGQKCKFIGLSFFEPDPVIIKTFDSDIPLHQRITPINNYNFVSSK